MDNHPKQPRDYLNRLVQSPKAGALQPLGPNIRGPLSPKPRAESTINTSELASQLRRLDPLAKTQNRYFTLLADEREFRPAARAPQLNHSIDFTVEAQDPQPQVQRILSKKRTRGQGSRRDRAHLIQSVQVGRDMKKAFQQSSNVDDWRQKMNQSNDFSQQEQILSFINSHQLKEQPPFERPKIQSPLSLPDSPPEYLDPRNRESPLQPFSDSSEGGQPGVRFFQKRFESKERRTTQKFSRMKNLSRVNPQRLTIDLTAEKNSLGNNYFSPQHAKMATLETKQIGLDQNTPQGQKQPNHFVLSERKKKNPHFGQNFRRISLNQKQFQKWQAQRKEQLSQGPSDMQSVAFPLAEYKLKERPTARDTKGMISEVKRNLVEQSNNSSFHHSSFNPVDHLKEMSIDPKSSSGPQPESFASSQVKQSSVGLQGQWEPSPVQPVQLAQQNQQLQQQRPDDTRTPIQYHFQQTIFLPIQYQQPNPGVEQQQNLQQAFQQQLDRLEEQTEPLSRPHPMPKLSQVSSSLPTQSLDDPLANRTVHETPRGEIPAGPKPESSFLKSNSSGELEASSGRMQQVPFRARLPGPSVKKRNHFDNSPQRIAHNFKVSLKKLKKQNNSVVTRSGQGSLRQHSFEEGKTSDVLASDRRVNFSSFMKNKLTQMSQNGSAEDKLSFSPVSHQRKAQEGLLNSLQGGTVTVSNQRYFKTQNTSLENTIEEHLEQENATLSSAKQNARNHYTSLLPESLTKMNRNMMKQAIEISQKSKKLMEGSGMIPKQMEELATQLEKSSPDRSARKQNKKDKQEELLAGQPRGEVGEVAEEPEDARSVKGSSKVVSTVRGSPPLAEQKSDTRQEISSSLDDTQKLALASDQISKILKTFNLEEQVESEQVLEAMKKLMNKDEVKLQLPEDPTIPVVAEAEAVIKFETSGEGNSSQQQSPPISPPLIRSDERPTQNPTEDRAQEHSPLEEMPTTRNQTPKDNVAIPPNLMEDPFSIVQITKPSATVPFGRYTKEAIKDMTNLSQISSKRSDQIRSSVSSPNGLRKSSKNKVTQETQHQHLRPIESEDSHHSSNKLPSTPKTPSSSSSSQRSQSSASSSSSIKSQSTKNAPGSKPGAARALKLGKAPKIMTTDLDQVSEFDPQQELQRLIGDYEGKKGRPFVKKKPHVLPVGRDGQHGLSLQQERRRLQSTSKAAAVAVIPNDRCMRSTSGFANFNLKPMHQFGVVSRYERGRFLMIYTDQALRVDFFDEVPFDERVGNQITTRVRQLIDHDSTKLVQTVRRTLLTELHADLSKVETIMKDIDSFGAVEAAKPAPALPEAKATAGEASAEPFAQQKRRMSLVRPIKSKHALQFQAIYKKLITKKEEEKKDQKDQGVKPAKEGAKKDSSFIKTIVSKRQTLMNKFQHRIRINKQFSILRLSVPQFKQIVVQQINDQKLAERAQTQKKQDLLRADAKKQSEEVSKKIKGNRRGSTVLKRLPLSLAALSSGDSRATTPRKRAFTRGLSTNLPKEPSQKKPGDVSSGQTSKKNDVRKSVPMPKPPPQQKAPPSTDEKLVRDSSMQSTLNKNLALEGEKDEERSDNRAVPNLLDDLMALNIFVMEKEEFQDLEQEILTIFWLKEYLNKDQKASFQKNKYRGLHLTEECLRTAVSETSSQKNNKPEAACKCQEFLFNDLSHEASHIEFTKILAKIRKGTDFYMNKEIVAYNHSRHQSFPHDMMEAQKRNRMLATSYTSLTQHFKLAYLKSEVSFCQLDKDEWKANRFRVVREQQWVRYEYLFAEQTKIFWETQELLETIKGANVEVPSVDSNVSLSYGEEMLAKNSFSSMSQKSLSSTSEMEAQNDLYQINISHEFNNTLRILGQVIAVKNMHYEIFLILSQSKLDKVKNKIIEDKSEKINLREQYIDYRLEQIRQIACRNKAFIKKHFLEESDDSSDFGSQDSIKQTSKYFFIEHYKMTQEWQRMAKLKGLKDRLKQKNNKLSKLTMLVNQKLSVPQNEQQEQMQEYKRTNKANQSQNATYGFRYGKMNPQFQAEQSAFQVEVKKQAGVIRLSNGLQLSLGDEPNVNYKFTDFKSQPRSVTIRKLNLVQSYFDDIKNHFKQTSYNDNIMVNLQRKKCLNEAQINSDFGKTMKKLNEERLQKYCLARANKPALELDMTKFELKKYKNPFDSTLPNPLRFGSKSKDFIFKIKMQSLSNFTQLQYLKEQRNFLSHIIPSGQGGRFQESELMTDVTTYSTAVSETGFPIYLMFEVVHVARKTAFDFSEEQNRMAMKFKAISKQKGLSISQPKKDGGIKNEKVFQQNKIMQIISVQMTANATDEVIKKAEEHQHKKEVNVQAKNIFGMLPKRITMKFPHPPPLEKKEHRPNDIGFVPSVAATEGTVKSASRMKRMSTMQPKKNSEGDLSSERAEKLTPFKGDPIFNVIQENHEEESSHPDSGKSPSKPVQILAEQLDDDLSSAKSHSSFSYDGKPSPQKTSRNMLNLEGFTNLSVMSQSLKSGESESVSTCNHPLIKFARQTTLRNLNQAPVKGEDLKLRPRTRNFSVVGNMIPFSQSLLDPNKSHKHLTPRGTSGEHTPSSQFGSRLNSNLLRIKNIVGDFNPQKRERAKQKEGRLKRNSIAQSDNKYLFQALKRANNQYTIERHLDEQRKEEGSQRVLGLPGSLPLLKKISSGPHTPESNFRGLNQIPPLSPRGIDTQRGTLNKIDEFSEDTEHKKSKQPPKFFIQLSDHSDDDARPSDEKAPRREARERVLYTSKSVIGIAAPQDQKQIEKPALARKKVNRMLTKQIHQRVVKPAVHGEEVSIKAKHSSKSATKNDARPPQKSNTLSKQQWGHLDRRITMKFPQKTRSPSLPKNYLRKTLVVPAEPKPEGLLTITKLEKDLSPRTSNHHVESSESSASSITEQDTMNDFLEVHEAEYDATLDGFQEQVPRNVFGESECESIASNVSVETNEQLKRMRELENKTNQDRIYTDFLLKQQKQQKMKDRLERTLLGQKERNALIQKMWAEEQSQMKFLYSRVPKKKRTKPKDASHSTEKPGLMIQGSSGNPSFRFSINPGKTTIKTPGPSNPSAKVPSFGQVIGKLPIGTPVVSTQKSQAPEILNFTGAANATLNLTPGGLNPLRKGDIIEKASVSTPGTHSRQSKRGRSPFNQLSKASLGVKLFIDN